MPAEVVVFRGIKFRRYPDSPRRDCRVYFTPGCGDKQNGVGRLHEEIWQAAHGPIPKGYHVHHVDGNPRNNLLGNLICVPGSQHLSEHAKTSAWLLSLECQAHLEEIRPLAAVWHGSEEGKTWHSQHAKEAWKNRQPGECQCDYCGKLFLTKVKGRKGAGKPRFCSNPCKSANRRALGIDNEIRNCPACGVPFTVNKYSKVTHCSRSCSKRRSK